MVVILLATIGIVGVLMVALDDKKAESHATTASLATSDHLLSVSGDGYTPEGTISLADAAIAHEDHAILIEFARGSTLCNDAA